MTNVQHLTTGTFAAAVAGPGITVIDFWAAWCGPCRAIAPQFQRAAQLRRGCRFAKVDVDAEPALAARYGVRSIPTLLLRAFVGANQWLYVLVGACPVSLVLRRALHLRCVIYDNDSAAARAQEVRA